MQTPTTTNHTPAALQDNSTIAAFPEVRHYWEAASQGQLMLKRCEDCGEVHHYPRAICPLCGGDRCEWVRASGNGTVYSVSIMRRGPRTPFAIAYVTLEEGVTMLTHIVDCDLETVRIGDRVSVTFQADESGLTLPMFRPATKGAA